MGRIFRKDASSCSAGVQRARSISRALVIGFIALAMGAWPEGSGAHAQNVRFEKHVLTRDFISEGAAVGDVNKDGQIDILAGAFWFEAPHWTPHEITTPQTFAPDSGYSNSFLNFTQDVNLDGWVDFIRIGFPGTSSYWFENPQGQPGHWTSHRIHAAVGNESPRHVDVDGDGRNDLLFADTEARQMIWLRAPTTPGDTVWTRHPISRKQAPGTRRFSHGLGLGDLNGDGRKDVIIRHGWWEAPPHPRSEEWTFHEAHLGAPQAQMYVCDVDADGDADVVGSSAHDYGLWWYEQGPPVQGAARQDRRTWTRHLIHDAISQTHGLDFADVNADGFADLITGKRYYAHLGKDPGAHEPAVLYWFEWKQASDGAPTWTPHRIDADSGVGLQVVAQDITGDDRTDIVVANKKGVFFFRQR